MPSGPTYRKTYDIHLEQLQRCLTFLAGELQARADRAEQALTTQEAAARGATAERARANRELALTIRFLLADVEALEPLVEDPRLRQVTLMALSKSVLEAQNRKPGGA